MATIETNPELGQQIVEDAKQYVLHSWSVQDAINRYLPITPGFFGASKSKNNEMYLRWGLKSRTNDEMREDFLARVTELVEKDFGLKLPKI